MKTPLQHNLVASWTLKDGMKTYDSEYAYVELPVSLDVTGDIPVDDILSAINEEV